MVVGGGSSVPLVVMSFSASGTESAARRRPGRGPAGQLQNSRQSQMSIRPESLMAAR